MIINPFSKHAKERRAARLAQIRERANDAARRECYQGQQWQEVLTGFDRANPAPVPSNLAAIEAEQAQIRAEIVRLWARDEALEQSREKTLTEALQSARAAAALSLSNVENYEAQLATPRRIPGSRPSLQGARRSNF